MSTPAWQITYGIEYAIGALAVFAAACRHPKVASPLSLLLTVAVFSYFFVVSFTRFFTRGYVYFGSRQANELRFYYAFEVVTVPLIWGLICLVLLSVGTHHAHHHRLIRILLGISIIGSLVFFIVEDIKWYNNGFFYYYFNDQLTISVYKWERYIYFWISFVAIVFLKHRQHRGQLTHVSHECIDRHKLTTMLTLKVVMFVCWFIVEVSSGPYSNFLTLVLDMLGLIHNAVQIAWFLLVLRVSYTSGLPA
jgi:hypothetical protein